MDVTQFLTALGIIIVIDIVLGGDNAVVIALASKNLPEKQRNKAIIYGTGLAILVRVVFTIIAVWLLTIPYLMLVGGILLVWISIKLLTDNKEETDISSSATLMTAIKTIVIADVAMGLDNVLAIAGAAHGNIWLVVIGLLISVPIIVWGSKLILYLLDKYPVIIYIGAGVLALTAGKMITHEQVLEPIIYAEPYLNWVVPIALIVFVLLIGRMINAKHIATSRQEN